MSIVRGAQAESLLAFTADRLAQLAADLRQRFAAARPFPHVVIDGLLPEEVLDRVLQEFPTPSQIDWIRYDAPRERKLESPGDAALGAWTRHVLAQFNSSAFVTFLEQLTGLSGLVPDPHFSGGGLHQIEWGGYLSVHADFNWLHRLGLYRRVNVLLYLNKDWLEAYGGHLELWDAQMAGCVQRILPSFNRCVIFRTSDTSYHGHPEALACPEGQTRKSLAIYYYASGCAGQRAPDEHSTRWQLRPGERPSPA